MVSIVRRRDNRQAMASVSKVVGSLVVELVFGLVDGIR